MGLINGMPPTQFAFLALFFTSSPSVAGIVAADIVLRTDRQVDPTNAAREADNQTHRRADHRAVQAPPKLCFVFFFGGGSFSGYGQTTARQINRIISVYLVEENVLSPKC